MKIFLYEFITGGGLVGSGDLMSSSIFAEATAIIRALAADFCAIDHAQVSALKDYHLTDFDLPGCQVSEVTTSDEEHEAFRRLSCDADWTVVIAPEFDGNLESRTRWVEESGGRLLSPSSKIVELTADKQKTSAHLATAGLRVPEARLLAPAEPLPADFRYPAVLKPIDGAGSIDVDLIADAQQSPFWNSEKPRLLERFVPGTPVSVAVLCGPAGHVPLPACRQCLRTFEGGAFHYEGGWLPLDAAEARRAEELALRTIASLDSPLGYLGVDLILGDDATGADDRVIEINPRLTTSYVGLRAASTTNLAAAMLAVARGRRPSLSFRAKRVEFDSDGTVRT